MNKFKAGDKVYCPQAGHNVFEVQKHSKSSEYSLKIYLDDGTVETFTENGKKYSNDKAVSIFYATPEKQKQLEALHGIKLEDAPAKPTSLEIIQAMLDIKKLPVPCWASNIDEQPSSINKWVFIDKVVDSNYPFVGGDGCHWKFAIPFDPTTLQPITELPE